MLGYALINVKMLFVLKAKPVQEVFAQMFNVAKFNAPLVLIVKLDHVSLTYFYVRQLAMFKQKSALILDQMKLPVPRETIFELPILNSVV